MLLLRAQSIKAQGWVEKESDPLPFSFSAFLPHPSPSSFLRLPRWLVHHLQKL